MKSNLAQNLKLVSIGNSKGVRLPQRILHKYGIAGDLLLEETKKGILLRPKIEKKLSWEETYKAMAQEKEDWSDFDNTLMDGLED